MKTTKLLRVGLAGLGRFGSMHANIFHTLPNVELFAIAEPRAEQLAFIGTKYNVKRQYKSAEELINDDEIDAIAIVTPDDQHHRQCLAAIATGKPVFIEKPLAANFAKANELMQAAENSGSILQVGFILRYELNHRLINQQINQKEFGELISIRTKRNLSSSWFAANADRVHTIYESSIHDLDLLLWLTNSKPICVTAHERRLGDHLSPEACIALIKFENNCIGITETSWFVPKGAPTNVSASTWNGCIDSELAIVGSNKSIQLRSLDSALQIWSNEGINSPDGNLWPEIDEKIQGALQEELIDFTNCASAKSKSKIANLNQAINGLQLADAIVESASRGITIRL